MIAAIIILLFGFALITESKWEPMLYRFFQKIARRPHVLPALVDERLVADSPLNRASTFWNQYIGKRVKVLRFGPDGLADVHMDGQPTEVQGVAPERFTST